MVFGRSDGSHAVLQWVLRDLSDFTLPQTPSDSTIRTSATTQPFFQVSMVVIAMGRVSAPSELLRQFYLESGVSRSGRSCSDGTPSWDNGVLPVFTAAR